MYRFTPEEQRFLESMKVARLATAGNQQPLAKPHCVPVCFAYVDGEVWIALDEKPKSGRPLRRVRNIETNPQVALTVDHYEDDWTKLAYLIVDGEARLCPLSDTARVALLRRYPQYASMRLEQAIAIVPSHAVFWRHTSSEG